MLLQVVGWNDRFENNRTRELKCITWIPLPINHDGDGYTELLDHPQGAAHWGAWVAILQIAGKCGTRGILVRESRIPHDANSLARITRIPESIFQDVIPRLLLIGWIVDIHEDVTIPQEGAAIPQEGASSRAGAEWNGKNGKNGKNSTSEPVAGAPSPAKAVGSSSLEQIDPLEKYDALAGFHEPLRLMIYGAHPKSRQPPIGTQKWFAEREELAKLVRLDRNEPQEIIDCLTWVYGREEANNGFSYRSIIRTIASLRDRMRDKRTKFEGAMEKWKAATTGGGHGAPPQTSILGKGDHPW